MGNRLSRQPRVARPYQVPIPMPKSLKEELENEHSTAKHCAHQLTAVYGYKLNSDQKEQFQHLLAAIDYQLRATTHVYLHIFKRRGELPFFHQRDLNPEDPFYVLDQSTIDKGVDKFEFVEIQETDKESHHSQQMLKVKNQLVRLMETLFRNLCKHCEEGEEDRMSVWEKQNRMLAAANGLMLHLQTMLSAVNKFVQEEKE